MTKIKIGIIGYGKWVKEAYVPAISYYFKAEIVAISAKSHATITTIKKQFGNQVKVYSNYKELLDSPDIDAVMIAVPDEVHGEIIMEAINSGLPFFYEPPLGHTRALVKEVLSKLQKTAQLNFANLELGYIPVVNEASKLIKTQKTGKLQSISMSLKSKWGPEPNQDTNVINRL